jgi:hypothetical protein
MKVQISAHAAYEDVLDLNLQALFPKQMKLARTHTALGRVNIALEISEDAFTALVFFSQGNCQVTCLEPKPEGKPGSH